MHAAGFSRYRYAIPSTSNVTKTYSVSSIRFTKATSDEFLLSVSLQYLCNGVRKCPANPTWPRVTQKHVPNVSLFNKLCALRQCFYKTLTCVFRITRCRSISVACQNSFSCDAVRLLRKRQRAESLLVLLTVRPRLRPYPGTKRKHQKWLSSDPMTSRSLFQAEQAGHKKALSKGGSVGSFLPQFGRNIRQCFLRISSSPCAFQISTALCREPLTCYTDVCPFPDSDSHKHAQTSQKVEEPTSLWSTERHSSWLWLLALSINFYHYWAISPPFSPTPCHLLVAAD
jgi:hypothetical protein